MPTREGLIREVMDPPGGEIVRRSLINGREFKIIKHFYSSEEIIRCFLQKGIKINVSNTATLFYYASGVKHRAQKKVRSRNLPLTAPSPSREPQKKVRFL